MIFEPVATIATLIAEGGPPDRLIWQALPLTFPFTVIGAAAFGIVCLGDMIGFAAALITSTVLVLLLGLNVSAIGLVEVPLSSLYLVGEIFGLILVLDLIYLAAFGWLGRRSLLARFEG